MKKRLVTYDATVIVRVGAALRRRVEALAKRDRRLLSDYIRLALEEHVERQGARQKKG